MTGSVFNVRLALTLSAAAIASLAACGPSVQAIYEGNVRFEHCYRLDLDPQITPTHREACWREWKELYVYGQSRDRVDYADRRIRALSSGDMSRPSLILDGGDEQDGAADPAGTSMPANLHVAPPSTVPESVPAEAGAPPDAAPKVEAEPPAAECAASCRQTWLECRDPCGADAGGDADAKTRAKSAKSCKACDPDYKKCMRRCLK